MDEKGVKIKEPSAASLYFTHLAVLFLGFIFGLAAAYAFNAIGFNPTGSLEKARRLGITSVTILAGYSKSKDVLTYISVLGLPVLFSSAFWLLWAKKTRRAGLARILGEGENGGPAVFGSPSWETGWFWRLCLPAMIAIYFFFFSLNKFYLTPNNPKFKNWSFQGEEGVVLAWAQEILKGRVYGRDFLSPYGPMLLYPVAWIMKIFSPTVIIQRVYAFSLDFAAYTIIIFFLYRTIRSRAVFIFSALLAFIMSFPLETAVNATHLRFVLGLLPVLFGYIYLETNKKIFPALAGLAAGQSLFFSQEAGICSVLAMSAIFALSYLNNRRLGTNSRGVLCAASSFALFTVISLLPMLAYFYFKGALGPFLSAISLFPRLFAIGFGSFPFPDLVNFVRHPHPGWLFAFWAILVYAFTAVYLLPFLILGFNNRHILIASVLVFGVFLYRSALGRSDIQHIFNASLPAFLLVFLHIDNMARTLLGKAPEYKKAASGVLLAALLTSVGLLLSTPWFRLLEGDAAKSVLDGSRFSTRGGYMLETVARAGNARWDRGLANSIMEVQGFLTQNLKPGDQVYFFSDDAAFYFLFDLNCPVKHVIAFNAATKDERAILLADLEKSRPEYLVYDKTTWRPDNIPETVSAPEVIRYLNSKYKRVAETEDFIFGKRIGR